MNKFVIVSIVTDVFLIMCQIFVNATGLWTLLGNNHDLMIMQSWFDENAMKQLTLLTLDYICISRSGTPSRYTEIHFVSNCLSKKRNRPPKRPPNAKSSNANEVPPHSFLDWALMNWGLSIAATSVFQRGRSSNQIEIRDQYLVIIVHIRTKNIASKNMSILFNSIKH
jgi:hypothetical protein